MTAPQTLRVSSCRSIAITAIASRAIAASAACARQAGLRSPIFPSNTRVMEDCPYVRRPSNGSADHSGSVERHTLICDFKIPPCQRVVGSVGHERATIYGVGERSAGLGPEVFASVRDDSRPNFLE